MNTAKTEPPVMTCPTDGQFSRESWMGLALVATNVDLVGDGVDIVEMRNCHCGSTRCVPMAELYPRDVELEEVAGAYSAREVWDEFTDRQDFAEEEP